MTCFVCLAAVETANISSLSHEILPPVLHCNELRLKILKYVGSEV